MIQEMQEQARLTVVVFKSTWNVESPSPFCLKLLAWLRMANIEHRVSAPRGRPASKTGKAPYLILADGTILADSQRAIEYLSKAHHVQLDTHLSAEQKAHALTLRRLFEDHLYFLLVYQRWVRDFDDIRDPYFSKLPIGVKSIVPPLIRRKVEKMLNGQGTGRRSWAEIVSEAKGDIDAIATELGDGDYFFGQPSSIDAVAFGFLENLLNVPATSEISEYACTKTNLVAFCQRFRAAFFTDSPQLTQTHPNS